MIFFVNHNKLKTSNVLNLKDLVKYLNLEFYPIAIELNDIFVPKKNWPIIYVENFDTIEIVTIVGGG